MVVADKTKSPFSKECPQRPFECLISTLLKVRYSPLAQYKNSSSLPDLD